MCVQPNTGENDAFNGLLILMRLIRGPLFWQFLVAKAAGLMWCVASGF